MTEIILGNPIKPRFNVYDIREKCEKPPLCYDMSPADNLLQQDEIKKVLGVPTNRSWSECTTIVHYFLLGDWITSFTSQVTDLLESGMDVLVYSGDKDFICNWRGGEAWTYLAEWSGHEAFDNTDYADWEVDGEAAGSLKSHENFRFLRVFDAGHMVPMNQPKAALKMLADFIKGDPLN